jgi:hypothetical protein
MVPIEASLLKSFGALPFGATDKEALRIYGEPDEKEMLEGIDGSVSAVWHYWAKGFTLFFDGAKTDRFCCAEIDSSLQLKMWDIPVFSLNEPQLKELFKQNGFKELDEEFHEWGEKRITFDDAMADFYFENGIMVSVNFSSVSPGESELNN